MKRLISGLISAAMLLCNSSAICAENEIQASYTNLLTDGAIETAESIPDGGWKPVTGAWKSGLGTSVDIETDIVSKDSTKSAKIINAAIYQAVSLEQGNTYELSFDIYLNEEFDSAKLQWGIFNFNGSWIGTIAGGYNNGTAVTDSDFDASKTGEWQTVTMLFDCGETKNYVAEFLYSGAGSIYIDNAALTVTDVSENTQAPEETQAPSPSPSADASTDAPEITEQPQKKPGENILSDASFESGRLSDENSWKFTGGTDWYGYGTSGKLGIESGIVNSEDGFSVMLEDGMAGQRVYLESGNSYKLSAQIYPTVTASSIKVGFYDGTKTWPASNEVNVSDVTLDWSGEWKEISVTFECTQSQEYIVGFYESQVAVYIDNAVLTQFVGYETERIVIQDKKISDNKLIYNVGIKSGAGGDLITSVFDEDGRCVYVSVEEGRELQNISIPLGGMSSGTTRFYLWDSVVGVLPLSFPAEDAWVNEQPGSEITLNYETYPLYVGNASTTDFSAWDGYGSSVELEARVISSEYSDDDLVWTVSDTSAVSLSSAADKATVTGRRTGYVLATASLPDGSSASCQITILDNYNRLQTQRIELNTNSLRLAKGESAELIPILYPKDIYNNGMLDTSLSYFTSDEDVAVVSGGTITAVGNGTAVITVKSADVGRAAVCAVTVEDSVGTHGITADTSEIIDMTVGEKLKLTAQADGGGEIVWQSDNSYIADVDKDGAVTAYSNSNIQCVSDDGLTVTEEPGTVRIYATTREGGYTAVYTLRVSDAQKAVQKLSLDESGISMAKGQTRNITAAVSP
ncbi:MAG: Ig domain-containing protein, partial [Candidatus Ornithomonoglobus sp.]